MFVFVFWGVSIILEIKSRVTKYIKSNRKKMTTVEIDSRTTKLPPFSIPDSKDWIKWKKVTFYVALIAPAPIILLIMAEIFSLSQGTSSISSVIKGKPSSRRGATVLLIYFVISLVCITYAILINYFETRRINNAKNV